MTINYGKLLVAAKDVPSTAASASAKILYTVGADLDRINVTHGTLVNQSGGAAKVTMWVVESGGSVSNSKRIIITKSIGKNEPYFMPELIGRTIERGGTVRAESDVAGGLSFTITGNEVTTE